MINVPISLTQVSIEAATLQKTDSLEGLGSKLTQMFSNFKSAISNHFSSTGEHLLDGNPMTDLLVVLNDTNYIKVCDQSVNCTRGLNIPLKTWLGALNTSYNTLMPVITKELDEAIAFVAMLVSDPDKISNNLIPKSKVKKVESSEKDLFSKLKGRNDQTTFAGLFKDFADVETCNSIYADILVSRSDTNKLTVDDKVEQLSALLEKLTFWLGEHKASVSMSVTKELGKFVQHLADYISFYALVEQELYVVKSSMEKLTEDIEDMTKK